jgi:hypothetical protein
MQSYCGCHTTYTYETHDYYYLPDTSTISHILLNPSLASEASADLVDTSAQAALAPYQTTEQEESADTTFMVM